MEINNFLKNDFMNVLLGKSDNFDNDENQIAQYIKKIKQAVKFQNYCSLELYKQLIEAFVGSRFDIQKHYDEIGTNIAMYNTVYEIINQISYAVSPL